MKGKMIMGKLNILDKFCNVMIGVDNLKGKVKLELANIFESKPQSLGEGLAKIKAKFGPVFKHNLFFDKLI